MLLQMAATFCNPSLGSRRLSFVKHNITHRHAVGDSSQLRPVAKRKVMEIRGVRHPKESSEAGTHVPPGVEVETLRQCEALASAAAGSCGWELRLQLPQTRARNTHNEEAKNENKLLSASLGRTNCPPLYGAAYLEFVAEVVIKQPARHTGNVPAKDLTKIH